MKLARANVMQQTVGNQRRLAENLWFVRHRIFFRTFTVQS
jgi:hypothetical protein